MEIPLWLRTVTGNEAGTKAGQQDSSPSVPRLLSGQRHERFLDKTFRHVISFIEDTMFNERTSAHHGLLQMIGPKLKVISLLSFVVVLSLQKSVEGIAAFSLLAILLVFASRIPLVSFTQKLLPAVVLTVLISIPVTLNLVVEGDPLFILFRFGSSPAIGPLMIPNEIVVTRQGLGSAAILLLRVVTSVSFVFLLAMTTSPNTLVKTLSSLVPGALAPLVSISYRYIFFLVRKVEYFIMGLRSRQIASVAPATGRRWVASRIGLLFSLSMEFSAELTMAMESRGYRGEGFNVLAPVRTQADSPGRTRRLRRQSSTSGVKQFARTDLAWLIFSIFFAGVMIWKSLT